jgi:hypothetical protein
MQPLADEVGEPPDAVQVAAAVKRDAVRIRQRLAGQHFLADRVKRGIGYVDHVLGHRRGKYRDNRRAARNRTRNF